MKVTEEAAQEFIRTRCAMVDGEGTPVYQEWVRDLPVEGVRAWLQKKIDESEGAFSFNTDELQAILDNKDYP